MMLLDEISKWEKETWLSDGDELDISVIKSSLWEPVSLSHSGRLIFQVASSTATNNMETFPVEPSYTMNGDEAISHIAPRNAQADVGGVSCGSEPAYPLRSDDMESLPSPIASETCYPPGYAELESLPSSIQSDPSPYDAEMESLLSGRTSPKGNFRKQPALRSDDMETLPSPVQSEPSYPRGYDDLDSLASPMPSDTAARGLEMDSLPSSQNSDFRLLNEPSNNLEVAGDSEMPDDASYAESSVTSGEGQTFPQFGSAEVSPALPINYSIAQVLADPWFWSGSWNSLKLLSPSRPVDQCILDYHFLALWLETKEKLANNGVPPAYYLDSKIIQNIEGYMAGEFDPRRRLFLSYNCSLPMHPVFFFIPRKHDTGGQLIIFDFFAGGAIVLGKPINLPQSLQTLWLTITTLFGWFSDPLEMSKIFHRSWADDCLHFGPRVTSLFESALNGKWIWSKDEYGNPETPSFQCERLMLQQIFINTLNRCVLYTQHWNTLRTEQRGLWQEATMNSVEDVRIGLLKFKWVTLSAMLLCRNIQTCRTCTSHSLESPDINLNVLQNTLHQPHREPGEESSNGSEEFKMDLLVCSDHEEQHPSFPIDETAKPRRNVARFNYEDDDYSTSPIELTNMNTISDRIWTFGGENGILLLPSNMSNWTDRGFRVSKDFFQTVDTPLPETPAQPMIVPLASRSVMKQCSPSFNQGMLPISAGEMLAQAGETPGSDISHRIFIRGKGPKALDPSTKSQFLALDLEKDGIAVDPESVKISVDVDSLIWVVSAAHFAVKSFQLFQMPNPRPGMVGINKSNSVCVNLISPPTNVKELHDPMLRKRIEMPLSRIPHLDFGYCGQGSRRINFFLFFPRMIFKNSKGRYSTSIPGPLAELWHEKVILPACHAVYATKPGYSEYQPRSLQEIWDRTGKAKRKEINVIGIQQSNLMAEICRIVKAEDCLSCFGSPFIVADGRGMKFTTKQCATPTGSAPSFDLIKAQLPDLDWEQMLASAKGELYLDLGTSYHAEHHTPLVGFWRLPVLADTFQQMGSKAPTPFNFGTQKFHGGMSAEMTKKTKASTHLITGMYYCLVFEVVRNPGTVDYICNDIDVVARSARFFDECRKWLNLLSDAAKRSWGVRDEVRGLAGAVLKRLDVAVDQAKVFLQSSPILWVPSATYLGIACRRFRELLNVHQKCFDLRLPNYRLMSVLVAYLLRHTMVMPRPRNVDLKNALQHLRFNEVITMCGMFFLHGLHSKSMMISGLVKLDSAELVNAYKNPFAERKPHQRNDMDLLPSIEAGSYPWGKELDESTIKMLLNGPESFMERINLQIGIPVLKHPLSTRIFITFSAQIWLMLSDDVVQKPKMESTLADAISQWTLQTIKHSICKEDVLIHPTFDRVSIPSRKVLRAKQLFSNRKRIFFPEEAEVQRTQCHVFTTNPGDYLSLYYSFRKNGDRAAIQDLDEDLDLIFSVLPLLPASQVSGSKSKFIYDIWKVVARKVEFVANSIYFKCTSAAFHKVSILPKIKVRRAKLNKSAILKLLENAHGQHAYPKYKKKNKGGSNNVKRRGK